MSLRPFLSALFAVSLVACHHNVRGPAESSREIGTFSYRIENRANPPIMGVIAIAADSVILDAEKEYCRRDLDNPAGDRYQRFECSPPVGMTAFVINIDANHPAVSTWRGIQTVPRSRRVCSAYRVTQDGRRVCAAYHQETYFVDSTFGGRLKVAPISAAEQP